MTEPRLGELQSLTTTDGMRLAYRVAGEGAPVVLVPAMSWLAEDLAPLARGRTLVFFDVRGQGASAPATAAQVGFERDLDDVDAVRTALGLERCALLGWSYHGAVAARYAWQHRACVERLLLVGPVAPRAQPHWRAYLQAFAQRIDPVALRALEEQRRAGLRARDPAAWCRAHVDLLLRVYVAEPGCLASMRASPCVAPNLDQELVNQLMLKVLDGMGEYDWRAEMAGFDVPALIVHGDRDPVPLAGSREWQQTLAAAALHELPGCGHLPWLEQPERFFALADAFLRPNGA